MRYDIEMERLGRLVSQSVVGGRGAGDGTSRGGEDGPWRAEYRMMGTEGYAALVVLVLFVLMALLAASGWLIGPNTSPPPALQPLSEAFESSRQFFEQFPDGLARLVQISLAVGAFGFVYLTNIKSYAADISLDDGVLRLDRNVFDVAVDLDDVSLALKDWEPRYRGRIGSIVEISDGHRTVAVGGSGHTPDGGQFGTSDTEVDAWIGDASSFEEFLRALSARTGREVGVAAGGPGPAPAAGGQTFVLGENPHQYAVGTSSGNHGMTWAAFVIFGLVWVVPGLVLGVAKLSPEWWSTLQTSYAEFIRSGGSKWIYVGVAAFNFFAVAGLMAAWLRQDDDGPADWLNVDEFGVQFGHGGAVEREAGAREIGVTPGIRRLPSGRHGPDMWTALLELTFPDGESLVLARAEPVDSPDELPWRSSVREFEEPGDYVVSRAQWDDLVGRLLPA